MPLVRSQRTRRGARILPDPGDETGVAVLVTHAKNDLAGLTETAAADLVGNRRQLDVGEQPTNGDTVEVQPRTPKQVHGTIREPGLESEISASRKRFRRRKARQTDSTFGRPVLRHRQPVASQIDDGQRNETVARGERVGENAPGEAPIRAILAEPAGRVQMAQLRPAFDQIDVLTIEMERPGQLRGMRIGDCRQQFDLGLDNRFLGREHAERRERRETVERQGKHDHKWFGQSEHGVWRPPCRAPPESLVIEGRRAALNSAPS